MLFVQRHADPTGTGVHVPYFPHNKMPHKRKMNSELVTQSAKGLKGDWPLGAAWKTKWLSFFSNSNEIKSVEKFILNT